MGITSNLKLATISEQDNPKVKDFFQDLAGDVSTSNMQKIDEAVKKIQDVANAAIASSEKGKAGGVATLGSDKKVVKEQLPDLNYLPDTSTLEDIPDGATRKAVTQAEKDAWNEKSNFSGSYNDLADKPNLDFIPTSAKGIAGGVAPLGEDKKVPEIYLPPMKYIPTSQKGKANGVASTDRYNKLIPEHYPTSDLVSNQSVQLKQVASSAIIYTSKFMGGVFCIHIGFSRLKPDQYESFEIPGEVPAITSYLSNPTFSAVLVAGAPDTGFPIIAGTCQCQVAKKKATIIVRTKSTSEFSKQTNFSAYVEFIYICND